METENTDNKEHTETMEVEVASTGSFIITDRGTLCVLISREPANERWFGITLRPIFGAEFHEREEGWFRVVPASLPDALKLLEENGVDLKSIPPKPTEKLSIVERLEALEKENRTLRATVSKASDTPAAPPTHLSKE